MNNDFMWMSVFTDSSDKNPDTLMRSFWLSGYYDLDEKQWLWGNGAPLSRNDPMWAPGEPSRDSAPSVSAITKKKNGLNDRKVNSVHLEDAFPVCETGEKNLGMSKICHGQLGCWLWWYRLNQKVVLSANEAHDILHVIKNPVFSYKP